MKKSPLKRKTPLKAKTGLQSRVGLKRGKSMLKSNISLKRTQMSRNGVSTPKKRLDNIFSQNIRLMYADANGYVQCVTCGVWKKWNDGMDAGHFIPRQHTATRYLVMNVFPQCEGCNRFLDGQIPNFEIHVINLFGKEAVEEMKALSRVTVRDYPFEEKILEYSDKLRILKEKLSFV